MKKGVIFGSVVSLLYVIVAVLVVITSSKPLSDLEPNELGDLMAGLFAPLAFLWLVIGFFQQQVELRLNTEALRLQASELRNSVEQQREMVRVTQLQFARDRPFFIVDQRKRFFYEGESGLHIPIVVFSNLGGLASGVRVTAESGLTLNYPEKHEARIRPLA